MKQAFAVRRFIAGAAACSLCLLFLSSCGENQTAQITGANGTLSGVSFSSQKSSQAQESSSKAEKGSSAKTISKPWGKAEPADVPPTVAGLHVQAPPKDVGENKTKVAYLTFDDGPSKQTPKVLKILKDKGVRATFFVVHNGSKAEQPYYKMIVDQGHQLAIHSYTHDYKKVYRTDQSFFDEFKSMQKFLHEQTGRWVSDTRFPGGTSNTVTSKQRIKNIIGTLNQHKIRYYDWNVSSGDASHKKLSKEKIANNVLKNAVKYNEPVVLMHDSAAKDATVEALPQIIEGLRKAGYRFDSVEHMKTPSQHRKYPLKNAPASSAPSSKPAASSKATKPEKPSSKAAKPGSSKPQVSSKTEKPCSSAPVRPQWPCTSSSAGDACSRAAGGASRP